MNGLAFAAAAVLPALVLVPLNFDAMHGYYAYHLPVAGSAVDGYRISYTTMEEKHYRYSILAFYASNSTPVRDYIELERPVFEMLITRIRPLDNQTIQVDFDDGGYTVWQWNGTSYEPTRPIPRFTHTETIRVNQTFVTTCLNLPPLDYDGHQRDNSTGLIVSQYRGTDTIEIAEAKQHMPVTEGVTDDWPGRSYYGGATYATRTVSITPPEKVRVYKFLVASVSTDGKMRCDYPQVIEHTIDAKRIEPSDIKAASGTLYEWYKRRPAPRPSGRGDGAQAGSARRAGRVRRAAAACHDDGDVAPAAAAHLAQGPSHPRPPPTCQRPSDAPETAWRSVLAAADRPARGRRRGRAGPRWAPRCMRPRADCAMSPRCPGIERLRPPRSPCPRDAPPPDHAPPPRPAPSQPRYRGFAPRWRRTRDRPPRMQHSRVDGQHPGAAQRPPGPRRRRGCIHDRGAIPRAEGAVRPECAATPANYGRGIAASGRAAPAQAHRCRARCAAHPPAQRQRPHKNRSESRAGAGEKGGP